jgi:hypothetical protein
MTRAVSLILAFLVSGCATTPLPQTAREGTPLVPLSVQAVSVTPTPLGISTASGLQSAYNASAKLTTGIFNEATCNASSLIQVQGTIQLTKPLRIASGAVTVPLAGTAGAQLSWDGTDPPIIFISNNGGPSKGVRFAGVNIYAPNARALWEWDTTSHTGSAYDLTVEDCTLTTNKGVHINLLAPGDGRAYNWRFSNILIGGTGQIATNDPQHAAPIVLFDRIRCVNKQLKGPAFDLWNASGLISNCWIELASTEVLRLRGAFCGLRWTNNYIEPHGAPPSGEIVHIDGPGVSLTVTDSIYFVMPTQRVATSNGGAVHFATLPDCTNLAGGHPDWTQPLDTYADLLRQCFVTMDAHSMIAWPSGRIDSRGVFKANAEQPTTQATQPQGLRK